jgi:hypothetical protein
MIKFKITICNNTKSLEERVILSNRDLEYSTRGFYKIEDVDSVVHYFPIPITIIEKCTVQKEEQ